MELKEFLLQTQAEVNSEIGERFGNPNSPYPYSGSVFAEVVMEHMFDVGMTFEPIVCHFERKIGSSNLKLSGFALSEEADQLDLFVSLYDEVSEITPITDADTKKAAEQCLGFLTECVSGKLATKIEESEDAYSLVLTIQECYSSLDQIRIYVLTDRVAKAKNFKPREVSGKTIKLEVMDIERLYRHWSEGKPRDELVVNFEEMGYGSIPCIYVPGETSDYDYALTVIPGEALRFIYEKYGARLLEANVRSFLSTTGKVNKGIRDTLKDSPEKFMAYNNGIVIVTDEAHLSRNTDGATSISWLKGMQIVNGGQTTASIYFTKKKSPEIDLSRVRIPAKIIVLRSKDDFAEEALISDISKYANSQNSVKQSDLSANKPFHIEIERLAMNTFCPDGIGRWFYERASGSYNTMLSREGTTPARLNQIKTAIPSSRKITKTDLAKYINAWDQRPDLVSLGSQKNFDKFMGALKELETEGGNFLPDVQTYKDMIAKAILFKKTHTLVRPMFQAFQGNVTSYLVSLLSNKLNESLNLEKIWLQQDISPKLKSQLQIWAVEVNSKLLESSNGRMISEWAKKNECWNILKSSTFSNVLDGIPELS